MDVSNVNNSTAAPVIRLFGSASSDAARSGQAGEAAASATAQRPGEVDRIGDKEQRAAVEEAVSSIEKFTQSIRRDLNFSLDDSTGRVVVKVTDSSSGEIIRQIPSEEALRLAERLDEARSLLFKAEA
ncbi:flagellar protein FlaG [Pseudomonas paraeruginosa]|uniref:Flagellar protein FlaG n=4 Tax=Pseudomonas aeruginosa group TaxID=136841 RepID=A0ABD7K791_PSEAI|nr:MULTISPECIES: flagellar protein FlaG [Pseudomonas aeruginosa group]KFF33907.1 FlaG [Pseudomonas aeruginosa VRFPA01]KAB0747487.1 flagellar protein FlaG [Pseudomonas aeruginosa]MBG4066212.1 flagellar protein FlaG [Pseudomonas aeruginosa]MBG5599625.1 flagellar protein FlaG [Pseudomonas aeruginosa]MBH3671102.1 flagellar protein FlaG [Pseudomonas aeruginosa]